jgi:hypothetical protein
MPDGGQASTDAPTGGEGVVERGRARDTGRRDAGGTTHAPNGRKPTGPRNGDPRNITGVGTQAGIRRTPTDGVGDHGNPPHGADMDHRGGSRVGHQPGTPTQRGPDYPRRLPRGRAKHLRWGADYGLCPECVPPGADREGELGSGVAMARTSSKDLRDDASERDGTPLRGREHFRTGTSEGQPLGGRGDRPGHIEDEVVEQRSGVGRRRSGALSRTTPAGARNHATPSRVRGTVRPAATDKRMRGVRSTTSHRPGGDGEGRGHPGDDEGPGHKILQKHRQGSTRQK